MKWHEQLSKKNGFIPPYRPAEIKKDGKPIPHVSFYPYDEGKKRCVRKRVYAPTSEKNVGEWLENVHQQIEARIKGGYYLAVAVSRETIDTLGTHGEKPDMLMTEAILAYLEYKLPLVASQRDYISMFEKTLREYVIEFWPDLPLNEFSKKHVARFLNDKQQEKKWTAKTRNNYRHAIYSFFEYFREIEVLEHNPVERVSIQKNKFTNHFLPFMDEQVAELQGYFEQHAPLHHQLSRFIYYTFARPWKELRNARVMHLDMQKQTMFIPSINSKNGKGDYVFLPNRLCELIEHYNIHKASGGYFILTDEGKPGIKPMTSNTIQAQHKRLLKKFGLAETHHLYSWKPTGVCAMYRACKDIKAVQKQCRHSDINMTDRYLSKLGLYQELFRVDFE